MSVKVLSVALAGVLLSGCMTYEKRVGQCDYVGEFHDGHALCKQNGKSFFIDSAGRRKSDLYDDARDFSHGYAVVCNMDDEGNELYSFLDKDCKEIRYAITDVYGDANAFGNVWVKASGMGWVLLRIETGSLCTPSLAHLDCVDRDGTAVASRFKRVNGAQAGYYEYALYDGTGKELAPFGKFTYIGNFHRGLALYSTTGYFLFTQTYDHDKERYHRICRLDGMKNRGEVRMGYIDKSGQVRCAERFVRADTFNAEGYARVVLPSGMDLSYRENHTYSYISRDGMQVLKGLALTRAKATFLPDGEWAVGTDDGGVSVLVNRQGEVRSMGKGVRIAKRGRYYLAKAGREHTFYRSAPDGGLTRLCSITGSGDDVVTVEENSCGDCICFYSGYQRREYDTDGTHVRSTRTIFPPYNKVTGEINASLCYRAFEY